MIEVQLEGCIYELNFGYNTKMEGYANLNSDIPELGDISLGGMKKNLNNKKYERRCLKWLIHIE